MLTVLLLLQLSPQALKGHTIATFSQDVAGNRGLAPFTKGPRTPRYVVVNQPAAGFFLHGSNIQRLNGIYGRVFALPPGIHHDFALAYQHDQTGWLLALVRIVHRWDVSADGGSSDEWLLIDPQGRTRFTHDGGTCFPGAGEKWRRHPLDGTHYHENIQVKPMVRKCDAPPGTSSNCRHLGGGDAGYSFDICTDAMQRLGGDTINFREPGACYVKACEGPDPQYVTGQGEWEVYSVFCNASGDRAGMLPMGPPLRKENDSSSATAGGALALQNDGLDELPWQVVPLLDPGMLMTVRAHYEFRTHNIWKAKRGDDLAAPALDSLAGRWREGYWLVRVLAPDGVHTLHAPQSNAPPKCDASAKASCSKCRPPQQPENSKCDVCMKRFCSCSVAVNGGCNINCPAGSGCQKTCEEPVAFYPAAECGFRRQGTYARVVEWRGDWVRIDDETSDGWVRAVTADGSVRLKLIPEESTPVVQARQQQQAEGNGGSVASDWERQPKKNDLLEVASFDFKAMSIEEQAAVVDQRVCPWCNRCRCGRQRKHYLSSETTVRGSQQLLNCTARHHDLGESADSGLTALLNDTRGDDVASFVAPVLFPTTAREHDASVDQLRNLLNQLDEGHSGASQREIPAALRLNLRLALVTGLLRARREVTALEEAELATREHPTAASAAFIKGRCLLRLGHQQDGLKALSAAIDLGRQDDTRPWGYKRAVEAFITISRVRRRIVIGNREYLAGEFDKAVATYERAVQSASVVGYDDKWSRAVLYSSKASCYRRMGQSAKALEELEFALELFPREPCLLQRRGSLLLEAGAATVAIATFEMLLKFDRFWPRIGEWLFRAHRRHRQERDGHETTEDGSTVHSGDFYMLLGVSTEYTAEELKHAYRMASLKVHPDKKGGDVRAFRRLSEAYETLADPVKRRAYDEGSFRSGGGEGDTDSNGDLSLKEEVDRKYFPERFEFWPFGNPFAGRPS